MTKKNIIKTSNKDWLKKAIKCYNEKKKFIIEDDAKIGLTSEDLTSVIKLIAVTHNQRSVSWQQIVGVLTGIGISSAGIYLILLAIADPDPTSTLGLLIFGGLTLAFTGGVGTLYSLGVTFVVTARGPGGGSFEVSPGPSIS